MAHNNSGMQPGTGHGAGESTEFKVRPERPVRAEQDGSLFEISDGDRTGTGARLCDHTAIQARCGQACSTTPGRYSASPAVSWSVTQPMLIGPPFGDFYARSPMSSSR
ncbi:MAG TPA: hypothetical protein VFQ44_25285 [Streptosporangiaceae bacterium]|nr:hypothetical protein [Streptosporangiaceae bacterium]